MTTAAWCLLGITWTVVTGLAAYFIVRVARRGATDSTRDDSER